MNDLSIPNRLIYDDDDLTKDDLKFLLFLTLSELEPYKKHISYGDGEMFVISELLDACEEQLNYN
tara:strand:+ start:253 stop:447 length:195 start_codon:yes stop_codon:yes gene_type:complete